MPNTFKILFRGAATTGSSTLYTTPASTTTLVNNVLVTNTASVAATYSINLAGSSMATTVSVPANDTAVLDIKQVLTATQTITGLASATTVIFHISGIEIT